MKAQKYLSFLLFSVGLFCWAACAKTERPIVEPAFTVVSLRLSTIDSFTVQATANDQVLTSFAAAPSINAYTFSAQFIDPLHRIRLVDAFTKQVLADTTIRYKTSPVNELTFFQPASGAPVKWVGPPVNEPLAREGNGKISMVYTSDKLPAAMQVVVENLVGAAYTPTDSFLLQKGQFSKYFETLRTGKDLYLKFYNTATPRKLLATSTSFTSMNSDYSIYLFSYYEGCTNCVMNFNGIKLY